VRKEDEEGYMEAGVYAGLCSSISVLLSRKLLCLMRTVLLCVVRLRGRKGEACMSYMLMSA